MWIDHLHFASNLKTSVSEYNLSGVATPLHKKEGSGHKNNTNLAVAKCNYNDITILRRITNLMITKSKQNPGISYTQYVTGPVKIGHVGSENLTNFQTFGSHNFYFNMVWPQNFLGLLIIYLTLKCCFQNQNTAFQY